MTDVELARALERGAVRNEAFHHADHLRVGWVYLRETPTVDQAVARMAATLQRFAARAGRPEKYSDAVTAFWMYQLAAVRAMMPDADAAAVFRAYPRLLDKHAALACHSHDVSPADSSDPSRHASDRALAR